MKPKGLAVDKNSPDFKKLLELSADNDLLASVDEKKGKFFTYLKNKLTPIQEEKQDKSEHKCNQFTTVTPKTTATNEDAKSQDVSQKNMPTVQLPSTNLNNNIESSSSQSNTNLQSLTKWNTTPEHIQQVTTNLEKQQQQIQPIKENQLPPKPTGRHHLPPVTRKTILNPVPQARSHHLGELDRTINYRAIYQPVSNPMASYSSINGQEWLVSKQRIQRPKDHDILTSEPLLNNYYMQSTSQALRPITDADIRKQEFIERKIAQEQYRQQLEHQIMQQKPVQSFKPKTTLKFDGEAEFKTESKQNYKPFRFVTSLNDLDSRANNLNEKMILNNSSAENEQHHHHHSVQMYDQQTNQQTNQQINQQINQSNEPQPVPCCKKNYRPQSSLTVSGQFKDHLQNKPDPMRQQRRHLNQIENEQSPNIHHYHPNESLKQTYEPDKQLNEELVDENNNVIERRSSSMQFKKNEQPVCCVCEHCRNHHSNGINVPIGPSNNQNQIELNPLVGVRALQVNKQVSNRIGSNQQQQPIKRKILKIKEPLPQQHTNLIRSKSTHFQSDQNQAIPRMIERGKQKPHKNMSHLKFEGDHRFVTTNNLMYKDHSMQNLSSHPDNEDHLNRGVFSEKMMLNGNRKGITGNIRGRVKNKYRDLFASSEDIFGSQEYKQPQQNQSNRLSVKYKSAHNLVQPANDDRSYYPDVQQSDKYRNNYENNYEHNYENNYENEYENENEYDNYPNEYDANLDYSQFDQVDYNQNDYQNNAYYQQEQLANNEQFQNEDEQYDEETADNQVNEKAKPDDQLIFVPKNQAAHHQLINSSGYERRKDLNTTNSAYGSQLNCPALNLTSDNKYIYKYSIGGHKYFQKKSSIS